MKGWMVITFMQPRQAISGEAELSITEFINSVIRHLMKKNGCIKFFVKKDFCQLYILERKKFGLKRFMVENFGQKYLIE